MSISLGHTVVFINDYSKIYPLIPDEADQMAWLLQSGVDGIITNRPGLLLEQRVRYLRNRISYPRKMI